LPNFILATKPELETVIPLLKGLKPPRGDEDLTDILKKVGQKTVELSQKIPNLISLEEVVESELNLVVKREKYSYLLVPRRSPRMVRTLRISSRPLRLKSFSGGRAPRVSSDRNHAPW
jgi:hypothetical protein